MLRRQLFARVLVSALLLFIFYIGACQYTFENFLYTLKITFDDFPIEYTKALNDSVALKEQPTEFDYLSTFPEVKIPRTIHFIWFKDLYPSHKGVTEIPSIGSRAPERCRLFNPNYEIRIWNTTSAREFLEEEYKWFLPTYDGYRYPIQRIDALKYFVLYHHGGVYMDLDIACRRSLDPLLIFPAWFPEASPLGVNNDLMASAPRHPIFKRLTDGLIPHNRNWIFPYVTIFWTTGPHFTSVILQEWYNDCGRRKCAVHNNRQDSGEWSSSLGTLALIRT